MKLLSKQKEGKEILMLSSATLQEQKEEWQNNLIQENFNYLHAYILTILGMSITMQVSYIIDLTMLSLKYAKIFENDLKRRLNEDKNIPY